MDSSKTCTAAIGLLFPPELLVNIVAQIGDLDVVGTPILSGLSRLTLRNLRLVNKAVHEFATPHLFHTITVWLVRYQLERLELISNQESLRHHIKRIVFRPWEVRRIDVGNYLAEIWCCDLRTHNRLMPSGLTFANFNDYVQNFSALPMIGYETSGYGVLGRISEMRQMWSPSTYTEEFLRNGEREYLKAYYLQCQRREYRGLDTLQLSEAFDKFDNLMHVAIAPEEANVDNNRFLESTGIAPHPSWFESGMYLIAIVVASLEHAKVSLHHFEIDTGRSEHHFWDRTIFNVFAEDSNGDFLVPFAGLQKLCITQVGRAYPDRRPGPDPFVFERPVGRLLEASRLLKELTIGLHKRWRDLCDISVMIPARLKIEGLRFLELHWFMVEEKKLFHILDSHRLTLRTLNLHDITLKIGTWSSLADAIRCRLKLTDANISGLSFSGHMTGPNHTLTAVLRNQRSCFAHHPDPDLAGSLDDYVAHKIDYNPLRRATDTGYDVEKDAWLPGTAAGIGWMPRYNTGCRCNKHMQIPPPAR
ncbi:hypothetical protein MMC18_006759 [Xylographa bjoerkii]|nr:hypothetical protein [Xylographa bjoerkii]